MLEIDEEVVVGQDLFSDPTVATGDISQKACAVRGGRDIAELLVVSLLPSIRDLRCSCTDSRSPYTSSSPS
jgi:hypothetical protein